jgi:peptidase E
VRRQVADLDDFINSMDILYVGGGNTANMLAIWREHGVDIILRKAWQSGKILCGISAGSICWFEYGITDSYGPGLKPLQCLGFIPGSNCPHYDGEADRKPKYHEAVKNGMPAGYAADDGAAIHFINGVVYRVVSSRINAKGYRVECIKGDIVETAMNTTFLG